jgi:putative lipoic acid-binding regulatory protein
MRLNGCKVFSATMVRERESLGERVTNWIRRHPHYRMVDKIVTQSSDSEYHCITITLFYEEVTKPRRTK